LEPHDSQKVAGAPQPGRVGHYQILDKLGAGGMGEVYRARDETLGRDVALKFLHSGQSSDEAARKRLLREARTASSLNHPNICTIYEVGETNGTTYIAMEYLQGRTLSSIAQGGQLTPEHAYRYALQIADALAYAHAHGVVHRDLKSANILVTRRVRQGSRLRAGKIGGLTAEETLSASLTTDGSMVGTIQYMAPNTARRRSRCPSGCLGDGRDPLRDVYRKASLCRRDAV
jgi:serine/threonine-protein kinase